MITMLYWKILRMYWISSPAHAWPTVTGMSEAMWGIMENEGWCRGSNPVAVEASFSNLGIGNQLVGSGKAWAQLSLPVSKQVMLRHLLVLEHLIQERSEVLLAWSDLGHTCMADKWVGHCVEKLCEVVHAFAFWSLDWILKPVEAGFKSILCRPRSSKKCEHQMAHVFIAGVPLSLMPQAAAKDPWSWRSRGCFPSASWGNGWCRAWVP